MYSRKTASRFIAEFVERKHAFYGRIRAELPTGKQFHPCRLACGRHFIGLVFQRTFLIGHVAERCAKSFFLLGTVRTPVQPVHLRLMRSQTLRERIIFVTEIEPVQQQAEGEHSDRKHINAGPASAIARVLFLKALSFSSPFFRHGSILISRRSGYDIETLRNHIELFTVQGKHFSIDHDVHRRLQIKFHGGNGLALRQGMLDVCPVVEPGKFAD